MPYLGRTIVTNLADWHIDNYASGSGFNDDGTTTILTLAQDDVEEESSVDVYFDGVVQHHDTWSIASSEITFSSPIPVGCNNVEVRYGTVPNETGIAAGTVATNHLVDLNVTEAKLANDSVTGAKLKNITLVAGDIIYASAAETMTRLEKGTAAQVLTMNTGATAPEWDDAGGGLQSVQVFKTTGVNTWNRPTGITHVDITIIGGGGGGGAVGDSGTYRAASGGGEGEEAHLFLDVTSISTASVTIGAGGTGGAADGDFDDGTVGITTSFGGYVTAIGGTGGEGHDAASASLGGPGGTGGAGSPGPDYAFPGHAGGSSGDHGDLAGAGGGRGAAHATLSGTAGGNAAANSGAGGGGAFYAAGGSGSLAGGNGGSGICIVKEYIK